MPRSCADVVDRRRCVSVGDERLGDRQRRQHVPGGSSPGDDRECSRAGSSTGRFAPSSRGRHLARACRATLSSNPAATIVTNNDVPPAEKNGNVSPVTGSKPATPPMLTMACTPNQVAMPPASSIPNRSGAASAVWIPNHTEQREPTDHREGADEPELVGDHGEDEVAVGERQVAELAVAPPDAGAGEPAVGDAEIALVRLVRQVLLVALGVEERREAVEAACAREHQQRHRAAMPEAITPVM